THNGYWYTNLGTGRMHPGLRGIDQLQEAIRYFHERGKLVVSYFSTVYDREMFDMHPEWREVDKNGVSLHGEETYGKTVCMNSPYREQAKYMIQTLVKNRDIDGLLLDMDFWEPEICYCPSCQRIFKSIYNCELPESENYDDEKFKLYIEFRRESNRNFLKELVDAAKQIKPDLLCYMQYMMLKVEERGSQRFDMTSFTDYTYSDIYFGNGTIQSSLATKVQAGITKYPPEMGLMTRPGTHNDTPNMKPLDQIRAEAFTILANGGAVHLFDIMWPDGTLQQAMWDRNAQVFAEIHQRTPWLGGHSAAQVAIYYSEANVLWYGKADHVFRAEANVFGAARVLLETGTPFDVLTEITGNKLDRYDVLILPNVACMSREELQAVRSFVQNGGGLVCTNQTSMFDERGKSHMGFGLSDVLGVTFAMTDTSAYKRVFARYTIPSVIGNGLPADGLISSWGTSVKVSLTTAEKVASIVFPYTEPSGHVFINMMANPPAVPSEWPACTVNQYGKGKAVYFSGQPEKDYLKLSFPEIRQIIINAVRLVMKNEAMVALAKDQPIELTHYRLDSGQIVVHMVNHLYYEGRDFSITDFGNDSNGTKYRSRRIIQRIYPVTDVEIVLNLPGVIETITLQPADQDLAFEMIDGKAHVYIPRIAYHEMLIVNVKAYSP
ncbi:MAG: beta-galactosidase trimerization domain-containing protein, partial [Firmicutes bacterium]|nr:beta-galactosidase trimerization domain-containing protein [Bacillota bacterium]